GTTTSIAVFDRGGTMLWSMNDGSKLRAFRIAPMLRRDPTRQIVAVWEGRIAIYNASGQRLSTYDFDGDLRRVDIDRPTSHHAWRIIASGPTTLVVLDSKAKQEWKATFRPETEHIARLNVVNRDKYQ